MIFFARYEASHFGSPYIETEHLLLGLLRENKELTTRFLRQDPSPESIRRQIEENTTIREKVSTSVDLPLSNESKRVLAYAAEEAERLGHRHIGTEHLLLGLLREEKSFAAAILRERGVRLDEVRRQLSGIPMSEPRDVGAERSFMVEFVDRNGRPFATAQGQSGIFPRVGEKVLLRDSETRRRYTVQEVAYEYQQISTVLPTPAHLLERILIVVSEESVDSKK